MQIKLAEALLRRKELAAKVQQLAQLKSLDQLFQTKVTRKKVTEDIEDVVLAVPLLSAKQVTAEHDYYAKQLRVIDAAIQQANWITMIDSGSLDVMADYVPGELKRT